MKERKDEEGENVELMELRMPPTTRLRPLEGPWTLGSLEALELAENESEMILSKALPHLT